MGPSLRSDSNDPSRPTQNSKRFDGSARADKPSFAEADDYFSPRSRQPRSTAYTSPLSFGDSSRLKTKRSPLTRENLEALQHSSPSSSPVDAHAPPQRPPASIFELPSHMRWKSSSNKSPTKSSSTSPKKPVRKKGEEDSHPLNLPPDQLRRLSARMSPANGRRGSHADVEMTDASPVMNGENSATPGAFPTPETNGIPVEDERNGEQSPTPPPHKNMPPVKVDPEAWKAAGNKFFKAKDYDRAIEEYSKAIDAAPSNPTYLSNRAAAYMSANKFSQALGDVLQASRLDPENEKTLLRLARVYTSMGRPQDALDTYAKIKDVSVADTAAANKAVRSIEIAERTINEDDGNGNMALWNIDQAKSTLGFGTPLPRKWQVLRAKAYLKVGTINALGEVTGIAQALMRDNSMDAEALTLAGRALYLKDEKGAGRSDYERAEGLFRQALNSDPDMKDAKTWLKLMKKLEKARNDANDLYKRGRYQDAISLYSEALTIDPTNKITNAKLLGNRALASMKVKQWDDARADCDQALKLDPSYTKARKTRAKAVGEAGDWEQAVKDLKALAEDNQGDPELQKELRAAELELKKSKRKDYYKILGVDKDAGEKEIERAYKKKAIALHPDRTQGDKDKEAEFKDCLEAKETLLDPQKRQMYDSGADLMEPGMGMGGGFPGGFGGGMGGGVQIDPEMLFNMMGGMGGMGGGRGGGMGGGFPGGGMGGGFPGGFSFSTGGGPGGRQGGFPF